MLVEKGRKKHVTKFTKTTTSAIPMDAKITDGKGLLENNMLEHFRMEMQCKTMTVELNS